MTSKQVSWTQSGHSITVEVFASHFILTLDGAKSRHTSIAQPAPRDRAMYAQRNAYGNLGKLVIYNDRASELKALRAELQAADPMTEYRRLESALFAAEEAVSTWQDRGANPAIEYQHLHESRAAFDAWCEANRELYEAENARRTATEEARRESLLAGKDIWGM